MTEVVIRVPKLGHKLEREVLKGIETLARAEVARAVMLEKLDKMLSKSKLTERDALILGRKIKKGRFKKLREMGLV